MIKSRKTMIIRKLNRKKFIPMSVLVASATVLPAQITREQADSITKDYLQSERVEYNLLYVNVNIPNEEGIVITTSNEEIVKAKYACWVYYLNESESELSQSRYLFVKEDNGNLLEVIASNDAGQSDLTQWQEVDNPLGLAERMENTIQPLYPNPVDNVLIIPYTGVRSSMEIHDLKGVYIFSETISGKDIYQLDVSFLKAGMYLLSVYGERKVVYKIIKN